MEEKPNLELEIALVRIARILFDYTDAQNDARNLHEIDALWGSFENAVAGYHNKTGRLHPDLCYNPGEWFTLKTEALEAKEKGQPENLPAPLHLYRETVKEIIKALEEELNLTHQHN